MVKVYTPWKDNVPYVPGEGGVPPIKPRLEYGETPEVGDVPRIGPRPGDPRCDCPSGINPDNFSVYEKVVKYQYEGKVMPGLSPEEQNAKNWFTGMPNRHPHPFAAPTGTMNTGRGCDTYGNPYDPPERYGYFEVFKFDDDKNDYELSKGYEVDWGPERGTQEFKEGMARMRGTEGYKVYAGAKEEADPGWGWGDPADPRPWEGAEKVGPNPWLKDCIVEQPIDQHARQLHEWAAADHAPWPAWAGAPGDEPPGTAAPAAIEPSME